MKYIKSFKLFEAVEKLAFDFPTLSDAAKYITQLAVSLNPVGPVFLSLAQKLFPNTAQNAKIRFIFPGKDWESRALEFVKSIGLVTSIVKDWGQAAAEANRYVESGVKAKELVIGSHGDGKFLIMPKDALTGKSSENQFLKSIRPLIKSDTTVFFTACHGADFLSNLVDAANSLNHPVYGSAGIYNYVSNSSEKGYYVCSPLPEAMQKKVHLEKREPVLKYRWQSGGGLSFVSGVAGSKATVEFTKPALLAFGFGTVPNTGVSVQFDWGSRPLTIEKLEYNDANGNPLKLFVSPNLYSENLTGYEKGEWPFQDLIKAKTLKVSAAGIKDSTTIQKMLKDGIVKGTVKITVNGIPVKPSEIATLMVPQFHKWTEDFTTNPALLKAGVCRVVSKSPVSWIEPGTIS
jgi:hypothetical protein